jgi:hypothetical protein
MSITINNQEQIHYGTTVTLETMICYKCAVPFAVPERLVRHLRDSQDTFYCPNGHSQIFSKSTETILREKLKKQQDDYEWRLKNLNSVLDDNSRTIGAITRQKSAIKGQMTKLKNRVKNGVCPCCNRTFSNLANHMKNQHPEFDTPKH